MHHLYDIAIVSIFGRANWLAVELQREGFKVALIDVSGKFSRWSPEEYEGPFGYFRSKRLSTSQLERLLEDEASINIEKGLSILNINGPIEFQGPLIHFTLQQIKISTEVKKYLYEYDSLTQIQKEELQNIILKQDFNQTWIAHLIHNLTSNVYTYNEESIKYGEMLSIYSSFFIRQATRLGMPKLLNWCKREKVAIFPQAHIVDMSLKDTKIDQIEVASLSSGVLKSKLFIWTLSSEESMYLNPKISRILFPKSELISEWFWIKFQFHFESQLNFDVFPSHLIFLKDIFLSWTHSNLAILQKSEKSNEFDVWIKIPTIHRFKKEYIKNMGNDLINNFQQRFPQTKVSIIEYPKELDSNYDLSGPPLFPVYQHKNIKRAKIKNIFFDGPEQWDELSWEGQMKKQKILKDKTKLFFSENSTNIYP